MRIQKEAPKAEPKDILSIDLNFKDIALASKEGVKKVRTSVLKKALSHKLLMEKVQRRLAGGWRYVKGIRHAIGRHGRRMRRRVLDEARKLAKTIVKPNIAIALEDLRHIRAGKDDFKRLRLWAYRNFNRL